MPLLCWSKKKCFATNKSEIIFVYTVYCEGLNFCLNSFSFVMSTRSYKEIALIACAGGLVGAAITKYLCSPPKQADGDTSVTLLTQAASKNYYIGVDIGGTTISIMILEKCGMECSHLMRNIDDPSESGVVRLVTSMVQKALSTSEPSVSLSDVAAIGVGSPGVNDLSNGIIRKASNFPDWNDFAITSALSKELDDVCLSGKRRKRSSVGRSVDRCWERL